jgi:CRISPR/Cas system-associated exonuclease Cas4 (RecB family)
MSKLQEPVLGYKPELVSISNSEMQTFKGCRRRWWLGNYRGLAKKEKEHDGPLTLGTRVHNALEAYYLTGENPVDVYGRLQREDNTKFTNSTAYLDSDIIKKFNNESDLGRIMIEGYMDWLDEENPDADIEVIGAEKKLAWHLLDYNPRVEIIGKVDLQVRRASDGSRATLDHKTAARFSDYYEYAHIQEQLQLYTLLERKTDDEDGKRVDGGIYNLLRKVKRSGTAKPPFYERLDVRFNDKMLGAFEIKLFGVIRDMMATRDALDEGVNHNFVAYPKPQMDWKCGKCPFFAICPMLDDGSDAERYIEDFYEQIDPNARYGENENEDEQ